jgi:hypothetical protein
VAYKNLIDNSSTTVATSTPGAQLDMRYRTTLSRASLGVPVRFRVKASSTVANDTGTVKIVDANGADVLVVPITGTTSRWYVQDGHLPATDAKYDVHYGGNTLGTLAVSAFSLYEWCDVPENNGTLSASIGDVTLSAAGTVASGENQGELSQSIGTITLTADGYRDANGELSKSIGDITISAAGVTWLVDPTSGVALPKSTTEYTAWRTASSLTGIANPSSLWQCTEPADDANLADSFGGGLTFTRNGDTVGNQAVTGWFKTGVKVVNTATSWWQFSGVNLNTTGATMFAIIKLNTIATSTLLSLGGTSLATSTQVELTSGGNIRARRGSNTADSGGTLSTGDVIGLMIAQRTGAADFDVYYKTVGGSLQTITPTYAAPASSSDTVYGLSGWETASNDATMLWCEYWTGTNADAFDGATVASFFSARGF